MKKIALLFFWGITAFPMEELSLPPSSESEIHRIYSIECSLCPQTLSAITKEFLFDLFGVHAHDTHRIYGQRQISEYFESHYTAQVDNDALDRIVEIEE